MHSRRYPSMDPDLSTTQPGVQLVEAHHSQSTHPGGVDPILEISFLAILLDTNRVRVNHPPKPVQSCTGKPPSPNRRTVENIKAVRVGFTLRTKSSLKLVSLYSFAYFKVRTKVRYFVRLYGLYSKAVAGQKVPFCTLADPSSIEHI